MNEDNLKELVKQGLLALKTAGEIGKGAAADVAKDATNPELKKLLSDGSAQADRGASQIQSLLAGMGAGDERNDNPIIQAHTDVSKRIREQAKSPETRDLGIIASGQLVMHYYIASYGTLAQYAERLGMNDAKTTLGKLLDDSKATDERMTDVAKLILGGS